MDRKRLILFLAAASSGLSATTQGESVASVAAAVDLDAAATAASQSTPSAGAAIDLDASGTSTSESRTTGKTFTLIEIAGTSTSESRASVAATLDLDSGAISISLSAESGTGQLDLDAAGTASSGSTTSSTAAIDLDAAGTASGVSTGSTTGEWIADVSGTTSSQSSASAASNLIGETGGTDASSSVASSANELDLDAAATSASQSSATAEAGLGNVYQIFTAPTEDAAGTLRAVAPAGSSTLTLDGFVADWSGHVWIVAVSKCGVAATDPPIKKRMAFDGNANLIGDTPLAPTALALTPIAGGKVSADWSFIKRSSNTNPTVFNIYLTTFDQPFDFATPTAVVAYTGIRDYAYIAGPYTTGTLVRAVVRTQAASGAENANAIVAEAIADATAPTTPGAVTVEVTP